MTIAKAGNEQGRRSGDVLEPKPTAAPAARPSASSSTRDGQRPMSVGQALMLGHQLDAQAVDGWPAGYNAATVRAQAIDLVTTLDRAAATPAQAREFIENIAFLTGTAA